LRGIAVVGELGSDTFPFMRERMDGAPGMMIGFTRRAATGDTARLKGAVRLRWGVVSRSPSTARLAWRAAPLRMTTFAGMLRQNSVQLAANQKSGNWDFRSSYIRSCMLAAQEEAT